MKIKRVFAMPSHETFRIKPIHKFIRRTLGLSFVDPFPYPYQMDALKFMERYDDNSVKGIVLDPPYSGRQLIEMYKEAGGFSITGNPAYWAKVKDRAGEIVAPNGLIITCGWNSNGLGSKRGFTREKLLIVAHGAQRNDTLVLLERKNNALDKY